jgi:hypothetical protein
MAKKVYPFTLEEIAAIRAKYRPVLYPTGPFAVGANARRGDPDIRELFKDDRIPLRPLFTFRPGGGFRGHLGQGKYGRSMCHHPVKYKVYQYRKPGPYTHGWRLFTYQRCEWRGAPLEQKPAIQQLAFEV